MLYESPTVYTHLSTAPQSPLHRLALEDERAANNALVASLDTLHARHAMRDSLSDQVFLIQRAARLADQLTAARAAVRSIERDLA